MKVALIIICSLFLKNIKANEALYLSVEHEGGSVYTGQVLSGALKGQVDANFFSGGMAKIDEKLALFAQKGCQRDCHVKAIFLQPVNGQVLMHKTNQQTYFINVPEKIHIVHSDMGQNYEFLEINEFTSDSNAYIYIIASLVGIVVIASLLCRYRSKSSLREEQSIPCEDKDFLEYIYENKKNLIEKTKNEKQKKQLLLVINMNYKKSINEADKRLLSDFKKMIEDIK